MLDYNHWTHWKMLVWKNIQLVWNLLFKNMVCDDLQRIWQWHKWVSMWNLILQPLKSYIFFITMPMEIKRGEVATYREGVLPMKSHDPLISPLPQYLWPPNSAGWWHSIRSSYPKGHLILQLCGLVRSSKYNISPLELGQKSRNVKMQWLTVKNFHP